MISRPGLCLLILTLAPVALSGAEPTPAAASAGLADERTPVVFLPGLIASKIRDRDSGKVIWGRTATYVLPKDGGYRIARPIGSDPAWNDGQEVFEVTTGLRALGVIRIDTYGSLVEELLSRGYRLGDLVDPKPEDTLFLFPYDLRYDNIRAARDLAEGLTRLQQARGGGDLEVDLICHSNAAHIARYFVKYGGGPLERAEEGLARRPEGVSVGRLILVGAPNGGTIVTLHDMNRGERYLPLLGRKLRPETLFTFRSIWDLLPVYRDDLFVDETGESLQVDLFDAENWRKFGWSIYAAKPSRRLQNGREAEVFADQETRFAYLQERLDRARRFNKLLRRDVEGFGGTRYYLVQGVRRETPDGALLVEGSDGWQTFFSHDARVKRNRTVYEAITSLGDGVAPPATVDWLSTQEREAIRGRIDTIEVDHRWMVKDSQAQRQISRWLEEGESTGPQND